MESGLQKGLVGLGIAIATLVPAALALWLYFLPTWLAGVVRARHGLVIFLVNLLLGWTGLGWLAALWMDWRFKAPPLQAGAVQPVYRRMKW
ncbi:superinfection immunity protein [Formicincola oecophyllae]|uniref:Superinfection immunity protein n=2 Tax=Formicincola oecophyllae TaxID=2558361 RepID=A0A4Y6UA16_9PROT|nr:superinfection immunity protein [Formicincola oecophyllae]